MRELENARLLGLPFSISNLEDNRKLSLSSISTEMFAVNPNLSFHPSLFRTPGIRRDVPQVIAEGCVGNYEG